MRKRRVYFDMDGVICDFDLGLQFIMGDSYKTATKADKWKAVNKCKHFFYYLPLIKGIYNLWALVPPEDRYVLSAKAVSVKDCEADKREYIHENFVIDNDNIIIVAHRTQKILFCKPGDILIDDRIDNIQQWIEAGGVGILFISMEQAIVDLKSIL